MTVNISGLSIRSLGPIFTFLKVGAAVLYIRSNQLLHRSSALSLHMPPDAGASLQAYLLWSIFKRTSSGGEIRASLLHVSRRCCKYLSERTSDVPGGKPSLSVLDAAALLVCDQIFICQKERLWQRLFWYGSVLKVMRLTRDVSVTFISNDGVILGKQSREIY